MAKKRSIILIISILLTASLIIQSAEADTRYFSTIFYVSNQATRPVSGCSINLYNSNGDLSYTAVTNDVGRADIDAVLNGTYIAKFSHQKYQQKELIITVNKNLLRFDVSLLNATSSSTSSTTIKSAPIGSLNIRAFVNKYFMFLLIFTIFGVIALSLAYPKKR